MLRNKKNKLYEQHRDEQVQLNMCMPSIIQKIYKSVMLLIFGRTSGMLKLTALHLTRMGISHSTVDSPLQLWDMQWKALRRLEQIVGTRRRLEHDSSQGIKRRPPANQRKHGTYHGRWGLVPPVA